MYLAGGFNINIWPNLKESLRAINIKPARYVSSIGSVHLFNRDVYLLKERSEGHD